MMKFFFSILVAFFLLTITALPSYAAAKYTLVGGALQIDNGIMLTSDLTNVSETDDASGLSFVVPTGMTFADLRTLSTDYDVTDDDCGGGSPRYQIGVQTDSGVRNIFVYIGPVPNFTGCADGMQTTDNMIGTTDQRFDLSQLGGNPYSTYEQARSLAGNMAIANIQFLVDGGWLFADQEQTVIVQDPTVLFNRPRVQTQCQNDGWMAFSNPTFRNQGDCVNFFVSQGRSQRR